MSKKDIAEIISELQTLQLRQSVLLTQLQDANDGRQGAQGQAPRARDRAQGTRPRPAPTRVPAEPPRAFRLGDRVRIINPGPFQERRGTIVNIGQVRNTVLTDSGKKITREPKNLRLDDR
jgi:transcription antitermination factor NusG